MSIKAEQLRKDIERLTKRESELREAKKRLERNSANNRIEIAKEYATGREEGRNEVINHLLSSLPPKNTLSNRGNTYNVLVRDIYAVIDKSKKGKK